MLLKQKILVMLALAASVTAAQARDLTIVNYGGSTGVAQNKAWYQPFSKATGQPLVITEWNGEVGKLRAMVETGNVVWDAVDVDSATQARGCEEGLLEKIDYAKVADKGDLVDGAAQPCGVGMFVSSMILAYNTDRLKTPPKNWGDFWDTKKFPGKRALRKGAMYTMEIALMADGVPMEKVYTELSTKAGVDRAFKKLDELKSSIQWWESGAQPAQYLASGDVVLSSAYNGRISLAAAEGKPLVVVWDSNVYEFDYWAIPRGSANREQALRFIASATKAEQQQAFARLIPYGPANKKALSGLSAKEAKDLPTAPGNRKRALPLNVAFWLEHGEALEKRFNAWAAK